MGKKGQTKGRVVGVIWLQGDVSQWVHFGMWLMIKILKCHYLV